MNESPAQVERRIINALRRHEMLPPGDAWDVRPADGGLNSQVWFVATAGNAPTLTVRMSRPGNEWILEREATILRDLDGNCNCAQDFVGLVRDDDGEPSAMLVLAHASGVTLDLGTVTDDQAESLAACVASIHTHIYDHFTVWPRPETVQGTRAQAFLARLRAVERYAAFSNPDSEHLYRKIRFIYSQLQGSRLQGEGWDERQFALLHGDLSKGNIIWDGNRVTLIDWEYIRAGDPAEEMAYLLAEQDVSEARVNLILESYIRHGGDETSVTRIPAYAALVSLDSALWWADRFIDMGEDPGESDEVAYHLSRVNAAMTTH